MEVERLTGSALQDEVLLERTGLKSNILHSGRSLPAKSGRDRRQGMGYGAEHILARIQNAPPMIPGLDKSAHRLMD